MQGLFADPKADVIFKKIFGQKERQHLLIELLCSLLELDEPRRIVQLEYLSPEQLPSRPTGKLSILDVKCTDARGVRYVIEMQVIEVDGFQKRVVYNACKAYTNQLEAGHGYPELNDVIALTICDFVLFPDQEPRKVPMLSRWQMHERHSGAAGLPEVQYVFLELPKYTAGDKPESTVDRWAYLFRAAYTFDRVPEALSTGPYAEALHVARLANLTVAEETEYERELMAEQDMRGGLTLAEKRGLAKGLAEGREVGLAEGVAKGLRLAIAATCEVLGIEPGELEGRSLLELEELHAAILRERRWPG